MALNFSFVGEVKLHKTSALIKVHIVSFLGFAETTNDGIWWWETDSKLSICFRFGTYTSFSLSLSTSWSAFVYVFHNDSDNASMNYGVVILITCPDKYFMCHNTEVHAIFFIFLNFFFIVHFSFSFSLSAESLCFPHSDLENLHIYEFIGWWVGNSDGK